MKTILILFLLFASVNLMAQNISGTVICEQNEPIEFATVALFSLPDSTLITGMITNRYGKFSFTEIENANDAFLQISFIGYEMKIAKVAENQTITLTPSAFALDEVVVQGRLPQVRLRNDAIVTTVENTVLSRAGTGNDVLQRLPLLTGSNGEFSVLGRGEAIIYINNRRLRDPSELDNLNSADIREVAIITSPGARYDASVNAVIRINTVRRVGDGFSFDTRSSVFQANRPRTIQQLNVNYRRNGWDFFGTFVYERSNNFNESKIRQTVEADTIWTQQHDNRFDACWTILRSVAGINYEISPQHATGIRYTGLTAPRRFGNNLFHSTILANGVFFDAIETLISNRAIHYQPTHRINAYYIGTFGDLNIDFNADFFGGGYTLYSNSTEISQEFDDRVITTSNETANRLIASRLIVSHPVFGGRFSLGSEWTDMYRRDNFHNTEGVLASSNIDIEERNQSVFAEFSRPISFGQLRAGLRYENVRSEYFINNVRSDEQSRRYQQWFPNVSFSTQIQGVTLQAGYTVRTQRPTFAQLRSHVIYVNRFTQQTGNPFLKPVTVHDVNLNASWRFIQLIINYRDQHNAIIPWAEQLEENSAITLMSSRNIDRLPTFNALLSASQQFGIWQPRASAGATKQWLTIIQNDKPLTLNRPLPTASFNNSFSLPNGLLFTLDAQFQGKGHFQNIYSRKNQFIVNASATKSFFNEQLRVELRGHDIFAGRRNVIAIYNQQMTIYQDTRFASQMAELTVRYRFNVARNRYRGTGAGQEQMDRM